MFQLTIGEKAPEPFEWIHKLSELVSALSWLAWPVVIIVLAWLFRNSISHILRNVRTAKAPGGFEATIEERVEQIAMSVERASEAGDAKAKSPTMAFDEALPQSIVSGVDPFETVIKAWNSVESEMRELDGPGDPPRPTMVIMVELMREGLLTQEDAQALNALRVFRNDLVHRPTDVEIDQAQAVQYAKSAERMIMRLRQLRRTSDGQTR